MTPSVAAPGDTNPSDASGRTHQKGSSLSTFCWRSRDEEKGDHSDSADFRQGEFGAITESVSGVHSDPHEFQNLTETSLSNDISEIKF